MCGCSYRVINYRHIWEVVHMRNYRPMVFKKMGRLIYSDVHVYTNHMVALGYVCRRIFWRFWWIKEEVEYHDKRYGGY